MDRVWGDARFISNPVHNNGDGWSGVELHCIRRGERKTVARVLFWDAMGSFFIETLGTDIPVDIAEALVAEAKATVRTG